VHYRFSVLAVISEYSLYERLRNYFYGGFIKKESYFYGSSTATFVKVFYMFSRSLKILGIHNIQINTNSHRARIKKF